MLGHIFLLGLVLRDGGRVAVFCHYFGDGGRVAILGFGDSLGLGLGLDLGGAWSCLGDGLGLGLGLDLSGAWESDGLGLDLSGAWESDGLGLDLSGAGESDGLGLDLSGAWKSDGLGVVIFRRDRCCNVFGDSRWIAGWRLWFLSVIISWQRVCCGKNTMTRANLADRTERTDEGDLEASTIGPYLSPITTSLA
jgi:hypothetical protein